MSLASKVRALEKRIADAQVPARIEDAVRVSILRDEVLASISTSLGTAMTRSHLAVSTYRQPADTDDALMRRHDAEVRAAALGGPPGPQAASGKATPA